MFLERLNWGEGIVLCVGTLSHRLGPQTEQKEGFFFHNICTNFPTFIPFLTEDTMWQSPGANIPSLLLLSQHSEPWFGVHCLWGQWILCTSILMWTHWVKETPSLIWKLAWLKKTANLCKNEAFVKRWSTEKELKMPDNSWLTVDEGILWLREIIIFKWVLWEKPNSLKGKAQKTWPSLILKGTEWWERYQHVWRASVAVTVFLVPDLRLEMLPLQGMN